MTAVRIVRRLGAACLTSLCTPLVIAGAQVRSAPPSDAECSEWAEALSAGGAQAMSALNAGWLPGCGNGGPALATAVSGSRAQTDATYLWALARQAGVLQHPQVFAAALKVTADPAASVPARAAGVVILGGQLGAGLEVGGLSGPSLLTETLPASGLCAASAPVTAGPVAEESLPPDAARQAARVLDPLRSDANAAALVRNLARCVRSAVGDSVAPQVNVSNVRLTYLCGNRFRVRNPTAVALPLAYDVYGGAEGGDLRATVGDSFFTTDGRGTVRLFFDGRLIQTKANGSTACPASP